MAKWIMVGTCGDVEEEHACPLEAFKAAHLEIERQRETAEVQGDWAEVRGYAMQLVDRVSVHPADAPTEIRFNLPNGHTLMVGLEE